MVCKVITSCMVIPANVSISGRFDAVPYICGREAGHHLFAWHPISLLAYRLSLQCSRLPCGLTPETLATSSLLLLLLLLNIWTRSLLPTPWLQRPVAVPPPQGGLNRPRPW